MYKYEIAIFVWERDFSDILKYMHNKQTISPIQLSEVDSVKELCKLRVGVLFSELSKRDIQILIDVICISYVVRFLAHFIICLNFILSKVYHMCYIMFMKGSNLVNIIVYCIKINVYMYAYNVLLTNTCNMYEIKILLLLAA